MRQVLFNLVFRALRAANKWITIGVCCTNIFIVIIILDESSYFLAQPGPLNVELLTIRSCLLFPLINTLLARIVKMLVHLVVDAAFVTLIKHDSIVIFIVVLGQHWVIALLRFIMVDLVCSALDSAPVKRLPQKNLLLSILILDGGVLRSDAGKSGCRFIEHGGALLLLSIGRIAWATNVGLGGATACANRACLIEDLSLLLELFTVCLHERVVVLFGELGQSKLVVIGVAEVLFRENLALILHTLRRLMIEQFVGYVARLHLVTLVLLLDDILLDALVNQAILTVFGVFRLAWRLFWSSALALSCLFLADRAPVLHCAHHLISVRRYKVFVVLAASWRASRMQSLLVMLDQWDSNLTWVFIRWHCCKIQLLGCYL